LEGVLKMLVLLKEPHLSAIQVCWRIEKSFVARHKCKPILDTTFLELMADCDMDTCQYPNSGYLRSWLLL
jgi:hypothetical protein